MAGDPGYGGTARGNGHHAGIWHYARGRAFVGTGKLDSAEVELAVLKKIAAKDEFTKGVTATNTAADVVFGANLRVVQLMTLMTDGLYTSPQGAYLPSILC